VKGGTHQMIRQSHLAKLHPLAVRTPRATREGYEPPCQGVKRAELASTHTAELRGDEIRSSLKEVLRRGITPNGSGHIPSDVRILT